MRHLVRPVAALAAGAVFALGLSSPAQAGPDDRAGQWLHSQLTDGAVAAPYAEGLTVDIGLAFAEIGMLTASHEVRDAMATRVHTYTGEGDEVYAGPVAKLLVFVQAVGADPRSYGDVDLVSRLNRLVTSTPRRLAGRIADQSQYGDYANTIGQAFAARGLARADTRKADEAIRFLLVQQCSAGYFRLDFARPGKRDQSCDAGREGAKAPDTDVTALAVLNLRALPRSHRTRATRRAVNDAVGWLTRTQKRNGSLGGGPSTEASNANSTGLAAWALGESGACSPARKAARWVKALQVTGDVSGTPLEGESGAIAYDRAAFNTGQTSGITDASRDQWRRTTAQAAPGLDYVDGC